LMSTKQRRRESRTIVSTGCRRRARLLINTRRFCADSWNGRTHDECLPMAMSELIKPSQFDFSHSNYAFIYYEQRALHQNSEACDCRLGISLLGFLQGRCGCCCGRRLAHACEQHLLRLRPHRLTRRLVRGTGRVRALTMLRHDGESAAGDIGLGSVLGRQQRARHELAAVGLAAPKYLRADVSRSVKPQ
jgi:hypothetical protein